MSAAKSSLPRPKPIPTTLPKSKSIPTKKSSQKTTTIPKASQILEVSDGPQKAESLEAEIRQLRSDLSLLYSTTSKDKEVIRSQNVDIVNLNKKH